MLPISTILEPPHPGQITIICDQFLLLLFEILMRPFHQDLSPFHERAVTMSIFTLVVLLPIMHLTATHLLSWWYVLALFLGRPWLDRIESIDELMTCFISTMQERILAPRQGFSVNSALFIVQFEDSSERFPVITQLGVEANGFPSSLHYDMVHHILFGTLHFDWLQNDLLNHFLDLYFLCHESLPLRLH